MPALTMRGRYLLREYWTDSDLFLRLDAREREVYVGLWMLADDEGWLPRDVPAIAAAIYRYEDRSFRDGFVRKTLSRLRELGKVGPHRCCIFLPAVSKYPRPGRKVDDHAKEHVKHQNDLKRSKAIKADLTLPVPTLPDVTPTQPDVADARAPEPRSIRGGPMRSIDDAMAGTPFGELHQRQKLARAGR